MKKYTGFINFFDDWNILSRQNLQRIQGKPKYVEEATVEDKLCEGTWDFPCVAYDENTKKYVGLYGAAVPAADDHPILVSLKKNQKSGEKLSLYPRHGILCYVESDDGVHWEKPDLSGIVHLCGVRHAKNQVTDEFEGGPVFYDKHEKNHGWRYKLIINHTIKEGEPGEVGTECRAILVSADALNWKEGKIFFSIPGADAPSGIYYDENTENYFLCGRKYTGDRRVFIWKTKDFIKFDEPLLIMHPQPLDPPLVGFYGMPVFNYEDMFIGLLWRIFCDPASNGLPNGTIDCDLAYSYNGTTFNRTFFKPFIGRNELGEHGGGCVYTGAMFVDDNDVIRFYSGGSKAEHFQNQELVDAALMLHTLRLDGFMYLATPSGKGSLRTKEFRIKGDTLKINVKTPFGGVRAQILDEKRQPMEGFTFEDCEIFVGDSLQWSPNWDGKCFGDAISNKRRQLEIQITTGELYAIRGDFKMLTTHWEKDLGD